MLCETRLAFGPNGMLVRATTGHVSWSNQEPERRDDGVIEVWDVPARKRVRTVGVGKGFCHAIALSPDGTLLAAALGDGLTLVRLDTGEQKPLPTAAHGLTFSPDGQRLVAATPVGVKFWETPIFRNTEISEAMIRQLHEIESAQYSIVLLSESGEPIGVDITASLYSEADELIDAYVERVCLDAGIPQDIIRNRAHKKLAGMES